MRSIRAETQKAIADAIREKTGKSGALTTEQMADEIKSIQVGVAGGIVPENKEWQQTSPTVQAFLDSEEYSPTDYSYTNIPEGAPSAKNAYPTGAAVELAAGTLARAGYEEAVSAGEKTLYNDQPRKITDYTVRDGASVKNVGTLYPTSKLRQIRCPNAKNVRDLGGWACEGGTVKYGKLYRGGAVSEGDRAVLVDQLGVRFDLDLRLGDNGTAEVTESPLGADVLYKLVDGSKIAYGISTNHDVWRQILQCVFKCAKSGTPLYFHCAAGRDRTGTVACIIEALLGVSQSDIDKDYELTCFADDESYTATYPTRKKSSWKGLITEIRSLTGTTFCDKAVNWAATLGFTAKEINDFRAAMIDGAPPTVSVSVGTVSINTGGVTNMTLSNDATVMTKYQPYYCELTPDEATNYGGHSVKIGGSDVSDQYSYLRPWREKPGDQYKIIIDIPAGALSGNLVIEAEGKLPSNEYTLLEYAYVQGDVGGVDTMHITTADTGISLTFACLYSGGSSTSYAYNNGFAGNNDICIGFVGPTQARAFWGSGKSNTLSAKVLTTQAEPVWYTVSVNYLGDGAVKEGTTNKGWNTQGSAGTNRNESLKIFGAGNHGTLTNSSKWLAVEKFIVSEGSSVAKTFKACRRNADNNVGFWCTEEKKFYASTGAVIGGAESADQTEVTTA